MAKPVTIDVDNHRISVKISLCSVRLFIDGRLAAKGSKFRAIFGIVAVVGTKRAVVHRMKRGHYYLSYGKNPKNPFTCDYWGRIR